MLWKPPRNYFDTSNDQQSAQLQQVSEIWSHDHPVEQKEQKDGASEDCPLGDTFRRTQKMFYLFCQRTATALWASGQQCVCGMVKFCFAETIQYAMRLWQILHQRKDLNIITKVSMMSNLPCSKTCWCWFFPMCSGAAASIRGEVVVKTKPNQSYSPCILQILLAVPLLFSAVIGAALSPPILRMLTTL